MREIASKLTRHWTIEIGAMKCADGQSGIFPGLTFLPSNWIKKKAGVELHTVFFVGARRCAQFSLGN
jgi:hypothetical protein